MGFRDLRFDTLTFIAHRFKGLAKVPFLMTFVDEQMKILTFFFCPAAYYRMMQITHLLKSWEGVDTSLHHFGGLQFNYQGKEFAHLHGNGLLDIKLNRPLRDEAIKSTVVEQHHILPNGNWVSVKIRGNTTLDAVIQLLKASKLVKEH